MNKSIFFKIVLVSCIGFLLNCDSDSENKINPSHKSTQDLFSGFQNPPAEARPFVRWWWNGNKIKKEELDRQLESLKNVGFGGVEINPIAMPDATPTDEKSLVWMSDEWVDLVVHACKKTQDLGMITDMIAGTGWPFGGEFLNEDETCQRIVTDNIWYKAGDVIEISEQYLINYYKNKFKNSRDEKRNSERTIWSLSGVSLIPSNCISIDQIIDLVEHQDDSGSILYTIKGEGKYMLSYQLLQQDFRDVTLGAPGGAGPVIDHYKKEMTLAYLNRMKKISERSGMPLNQLIRALFCDSIEVSGANWSDGFSELFFKTYGYKLDPWMAFVFYQGHQDYSKSNYTNNFSEEFKSQIKRVRFDYNNMLVETFLKNFTKTYKAFCEENGILCRYQAYGTPFLMGMMDGYMIPDIPESNNWIYSAKMKDSLWQWSQSHGYMIWNLYASSGAHLTGKKITSCETMTNTNGVFRTTLEEIKQHDDMNFITGINHSVLHGYNYSPKDAPFPGWIRYGAYFSEQNPWWKHLCSWVDYNARLSYVFQNSKAEKSIAILGPTSDLWGDKGLAREPFHLEPEYLYKLWEPISQLGYSCDYINQNVLVNSELNDGVLTYGDMNFKLLVLANLESVDIKVAKKLKDFVASGGKIVVIDGLPDKSLGYGDYQANDALISRIMTDIQSNYTSSIISVNSPNSIEKLFSWTEEVLKKSQLSPDVEISNPSKNVFQIHQNTSKEIIYFFTNINRYETSSFKAKFPFQNKYPYLWNPENGERKPYYFETSSNELDISLEPLQSLLLVFEDEKPDITAEDKKTRLVFSKEIQTNWEVVGNRVDGESFTWNMTALQDFGASKDKTQNTFAGTLIYKTKITVQDAITHLDLGNVNEGIAELYINGEKVGKHWYGSAIYPVSDFLKEGENAIEIHYTTVLANYCLSLDIPAINRWTIRYKDEPLTSVGLEGPIKLMTYE
ncbi:glycosyl hydrolase [Seonamhaeicola aphaedonensis]|uniref:Alpha-L-rhamnosidase-like protein n=1 Tax=Seonamhaeicola aphaedonensis TaxID=1461338 RepID=A0A3D9HEG7_9FLAO|nr:glycosyl hydrolase [Seonamhaeicola aphaedonensis]RED47870.1 alpha-L-rhamnosidase-like protein [Seonamhaeicola aphaedonensis]